MTFHIDKTALSDAGARKRVNQDALLLRCAVSRRFGPVSFAMVCDGLGGLSLGEKASALMVRRMERWFLEDLHGLLGRAGADRLDAASCLHRARLMWQTIFSEVNEALEDYGQSQGIRLGTTAVAFLCIGRHYLVMHVGDSRLYVTGPRALIQLTRDHSWVQQQIDAGLLTPEQAAVSDRKSVLLQCIGASSILRPDYCSGILRRDTSVLLCTDGFWRRLRHEEIYESIRAEGTRGEEMTARLSRLIASAKHRGERDNISAIWLRFIAERPEEAATEDLAPPTVRLWAMEAPAAVPGRARAIG